MDISKNYALLSKTRKGARESPLLYGYDASERLKRLSVLASFYVQGQELTERSSFARLLPKGRKNRPF